MQKNRRLQDEYRFPGFRPQATVKGIFGDAHARVVVLKRRQKKRHAEAVGRSTEVFTTVRSSESEIYAVAANVFIWIWKSGVCCARSVGR